MTKPASAAEYSPHQLLAVRAACLDLATAVGELLKDLVVVGGLVPSLLIDADRGGVEAHVGTLDLDVGLQIGLPDRAHFHRLAARLRDQGFEPSKDRSGETSPYRWQRSRGGPLVDFLTPPREARQAAGDLVVVDRDLEAVVTPGLRLAFRDRERVPMARWREASGALLPVCGPGAFVVLKALAFRGRHENKDAYDLHYVLRHFGVAVEDVAARLRPLLDDSDATTAVGYLRADFATLDSAGPRGAALFLGRDDDAFKADVSGLVGEFIGRL